MSQLPKRVFLWAFGGPSDCVVSVTGSYDRGPRTIEEARQELADSERMRSCGEREYVRVDVAEQQARDAYDAGCTDTHASVLHPDPEIDAEVKADLAEARAVDAAAGIRDGWHKGDAASLAARLAEVTAERDALRKRAARAEAAVLILRNGLRSIAGSPSCASCGPLARDVLGIESAESAK